MALNRSSFTLYAVVLREHPRVVKIGRTTRWVRRRAEYDSWNFANGDGVLHCSVYDIAEEYVDLAMLEKAVINGMAANFPMFRGAEWFAASLEDAVAVIEDVLHTAGISYSIGQKSAKPGSVRPLRTAHAS